MRKEHTVHFSNPQNTVPRKIVALDKNNGAITSSESEYLRNLRDAGKRTNSGGAGRDRWRGLLISAIDQDRSHPDGRRRREIEMLRVADMHRLMRRRAGAGKGGLVHLARGRLLVG